MTSPDDPEIQKAFTGVFHEKYSQEVEAALGEVLQFYIDQGVVGGGSCPCPMCTCQECGTAYGCACEDDDEQG